jgi:hypothetical protein
VIDESLGCQPRLGGAIAHQSLHGIVAFTSSKQFDVGVGTDGFERAVKRSCGERALGSQQQTLVDETGGGREHLVIAAERPFTPGDDRRCCFDRKVARQHTEASEHALFVRIQ